MLIGNDIVDLKDVDAYPAMESSNYLNRVFRPIEQLQIKNSANPRKLLWMIWTLKESGFKAWKRQNPKMIFSPISIHVDIEKKKISHHQYGKLKFEIDDGDDDWIAVYVFNSNLEKRSTLLHWIGEVSKLSEGFHLNSSVAVRTLVSQRLGAFLNLPPESIEVTKELPPMVKESKTGSIQPVSLSHHGRYVSAFMVLPRTMKSLFYEKLSTSHSV
ncbi:4'-phosphopantetheinyl transferase family protein [Leptospira sp. GIMC2001]|uniref:4'-phosphopantetheinyl transferase family protein n=1 Tax=Leptospira sp. GIMC2001 TaxID=1513297 RepID=UPI00234B9B77|nr:4'-phosphopantetheinyl transferase superfamily protein [Leptospira sp. GIMC2001]WCL50185.1 4'-phosphopantetheinyl transferase superfamily protein [Leptospira sp. GIMC2001]